MAGPKMVTERRGAVTVLTLNRPEVRNCIDAETAGLLAQAIRAFAADAGPRRWSWPGPAPTRSARERT